MRIFLEKYAQNGIKIFLWKYGPNLDEDFPWKIRTKPRWGFSLKNTNQFYIRIFLEKYKPNLNKDFPTKIQTKSVSGFSLENTVKIYIRIFLGKYRQNLYQDFPWKKSTYIIIKTHTWLRTIKPSKLMLVFRAQSWQWTISFLFISLTNKILKTSTWQDKKYN